jgi:3-oxoacyl-[acyl-carrier protein] reductase
MRLSRLWPKKGVKSFGQAIDVGDKDALEGWINASAKELKGVDIVVANVSALAVDESEEAWKKQFEVDNAAHGARGECRAAAS